MTKDLFAKFLERDMPTLEAEVTQYEARKQAEYEKKMEVYRKAHPKTDTNHVFVKGNELGNGYFNTIMGKELTFTALGTKPRDKDD